MFYNHTSFYVAHELPDGASEPAQHRTASAPSDRVDDKAEIIPGSKNKEFGWVISQLSNQCGCANTYLLRALDIATLLLLSWLFLFILFGHEVLPDGELFKLLSLFILAKIVGELFQLMKLPSLVGMLLVGIFMRSSGFYHVSGVYLTIVSVLREASLGIVLIQAGMGLDPVALLKLSFTVLRLAVCPGLIEAITVAVMTHYILGYPWLWGFALGFLLLAISPAVVVPTLLKLKKEGYGEGKGISTLVIAASSLDDVFAISVFSICISTIFSTGESLPMQILQGPLDVCVGFTSGAVWGLVSGLIPHLDDEHMAWKRVVMIGGAGLCAVLGSPFIGFPGAGPLTCITAAFVGSIVWSLQGWALDTNPVEEIFSGIWALLEPALFALIGAEVDLREVQPDSVTWALVIIAVSLVMRALTCSLVLVGGALNFKEVVYVNLALLPKATVQAALAPQMLNMVRKLAHPPAADLQRGSEILTISVLAILITAPLGSICASLAGPMLLAKAHPITHITHPSQNKIPNGT